MRILSLLFQAKNLQGDSSLFMWYGNRCDEYRECGEKAGLFCNRGICECLKEASE